MKKKEKNKRGDLAGKKKFKNFPSYIAAIPSLADFPIISMSFLWHLFLQHLGTACAN